jgi:hypothetical protein
MPEARPNDPAFMTFAAVQDRLVEAMRHWWRSPDSDCRFSLGGRVSAIWRQALSEPAFIDIQEAALRPLPLSRADIARMSEASEWLAFVGERDRKLVTLALVKLASGCQAGAVAGSVAASWGVADQGLTACGCAMVRPSPPSPIG